MSSVPENKDRVREPRQSDGVGDTVKFVVAFIGLICVMYYAWNFVGPSGQTMSVCSFIALLFREMFLVGFFGLAFLVGCVVWLIKSVRNLLRRGSDAL